MKPTLLLISGWAHGLDSIQPMGDALANRFNVQLLTGAQILRERPLPEAGHIIAHSMGGLLAMEPLPENRKKLVLISSTAKFCSDEAYPCGTPEAILLRMIHQLKRNPEAVLDKFFCNTYHPNKCHTCASVTDSKNTLLRGLEYLLSDVRNVVATLQIPVLLLHGTEDRIIPSGSTNTSPTAN